MVMNMKPTQIYNMQSFAGKIQHDGYGDNYSIWSLFFHRKKFIVMFIMISYLACTLTEIWMFRKLTTWSYFLRDEKWPKYDWKWFIMLISIFTPLFFCMPIGDFLSKTRICYGASRRLHDQLVRIFKINCFSDYWLL